jgi:hypothetical protein
LHSEIVGRICLFWRCHKATSETLFFSGKSVNNIKLTYFERLTIFFGKKRLTSFADKNVTFIFFQKLNFETSIHATMLLTNA